MWKKMMNLVVRYRKWVILFFSFVLFFLILQDVFTEEIISYDTWAHDLLVTRLRSAPMTRFMKVVTNLGSAYVLVAIILFIFVVTKEKWQGICCLLNVFFAFSLNFVLKLLVQRTRPSGFNLIYESGYSFPSAHSMVATAFYGFLIYLVWKNFKKGWKRTVLCLFLFLVICLIGISRVYLGVHYASDVIAGFFISLSYLMVFITITPKLLKLLKKKSC